MKTSSKWEYMGLGDDDHLYDEAGNKRKITTHDFTITFGNKYKGFSIGEISDVGYLKWLQESNNAKKPPDWYMDRIITMRLKELK